MGYVPRSTQGTQQSYLWSITKSLVDHAYKVQRLGLTAAKSPSGGHIPLGATSFQTSWRGTRTTKRQAPKNHKFYNHCPSKQSTPPGIHAPGGYYFRRYRLAGTSPPPGATCTRPSLFFSLSPGGLRYAARRHISTHAVLVLVRYSSHFPLTLTLNPVCS